MLGRQHLLYGLSTATAITLAIPELIQTPGMFVALSALGSLAPDLDSTESTLGKLFPVVSIVLNKLFGHRTYMHDPVIWLPAAIVICFYHPMITGFFIGYLGHILLDGLTAGGIPVCYLFHKKMFHILPYKLKFKSSSIAAKFATIFMCVITIGAISLLQYL